MEQIIKDYIKKEFLFDNPDLIITDDQLLLEEGIIDSLGIFTLVDFVQQQFGIKIEPVDVVVDNFKSVRAITELVRARKAESACS